jgi:Protein of unknown function (DUF3140)
VTSADAPSREEAVEVRREFGQRVNMTGKELERWLATEESQSVGIHHDADESVGHEMGRHIVELLGKRPDALTGEDVARMRKVNGYVARHLAQRPDHPDAELAHMPWTYSLRNWGHDPLK